MKFRKQSRTFPGLGLLAVALWWMAIGAWPGLALAVDPACAEAAASAPLPADTGGIGGTGAIANGGIGGTGDRAEGGIGGTGIVGTVTGFASVCVNGLEVRYDSATSVTRNGQPADVAALALGQVIAIDAARTENGLVARRISILNVLEGPVTGASPASGVIQVMGQTVRADASTRLDGLPTLADARPGMPLRVAGFRNVGGEVHATRIERASDLAGSSAMGRLAPAPAGESSLDGLPVRAVAPLPVGEVLLRGEWDGHRLMASEAQANPSLPFAGHADQVVAEGLILERRDRAHLRMTGFEIEVAPETSISGNSEGLLAEGQRIRVSGRLESGNRIVAQGIEIGGISLRPGADVLSAQYKRGGTPPGERPASMERGMGGSERPPRVERMERTERVERMERIPLPRPDVPADMGMHRMRR